MSYILTKNEYLTDIADAIRDKNKTNNTYKPKEMAGAISAIPGGAWVAKGNCKRAFGSPLWKQEFIDCFVSEDITNAQGMFYDNIWINHPFEINLASDSQIDCSDMFNGCIRLLTAPVINCNNSTFTDLSNFFSDCGDLRSVSEDLLKILYTDESITSYYTQFTCGSFAYCYVLDEIIGLYPPLPAANSNMFSDIVCRCFRLKDFIFATDNGTPYVRNWSNQYIDLTERVGFIGNGYGSSFVIGNEITADKEVKDDATYQALKDSPDWFTHSSSYSRYNHDSAVRTINSLPDCSSGSGNVIEFWGYTASDGTQRSAGELTDGGAIHTLTEEEIAVAAAKGWTVSYGTY